MRKKRAQQKTYPMRGVEGRHVMTSPSTGRWMHVPNQNGLLRHVNGSGHLGRERLRLCATIWSLQVLCRCPVLSPIARPTDKGILCPGLPWLFAGIADGHQEDGGRGRGKKRKKGVRARKLGGRCFTLRRSRCRSRNRCRCRSRNRRVHRQFKSKSNDLGVTASSAPRQAVNGLLEKTPNVCISVVSDSARISA